MRIGQQGLLHHREKDEIVAVGHALDSHCFHSTVIRTMEPKLKTLVHDADHVIMNIPPGLLQSE